MGRLHPCTATAVTIGFVGYQVYSNFNEIVNSFEKAPKLWEKGEYFKLGQTATDTAYNLSLFKSLFAVYNKKNAVPSLIDGLKAGVKSAQKVEVLEKESKKLLSQVKSNQTYAQIYQGAIKSGTSEVAMERRIESLSRICPHSEIILNRLCTMNELVNRSNIEIPGLGKKIKYDLDHLLKLDMTIKNGNLINIGGFHIDPGCMITNSGKIEVIGKEMGPGGIWRAILRIGGKQKESSFFPEHMSAEQVFVFCDKLLSKIEIDKIKPEIDGKIYHRILTQEGFFVAFLINPKTAEIYSVYPYIPEWNTPLAKTLFNKKSE